MFAKKSLGQNFLTSPSVAGDIVRAAKISADDTVLEVGPGKGILTRALLKHAGRVIAIEKDDRLIAPLGQKFRVAISEKRLVLIHGDILDFNPKRYSLNANRYKVVANIPYYITGELIRFFLENEIQPSAMTILVQKEVALRIVARDNKESILSISVKIFGRPRYVKKVPAKLFRPVPKVDSAILTIEKINNPFKSEKEARKFFEVVKKGFAHKRKFLAANLRALFKKEKIEGAFTACGINPRARAENLGVLEWKCLVKKLVD